MFWLLTVFDILRALAYVYTWYHVQDNPITPPTPPAQKVQSEEKMEKLIDEEQVPINLEEATPLRPMTSDELRKLISQGKVSFPQGAEIEKEVICKFATPVDIETLSSLQQSVPTE